MGRSEAAPRTESLLALDGHVTSVKEVGFGGDGANVVLSELNLLI